MILFARNIKEAQEIYNSCKTILSLLKLRINLETEFIVFIKKK